jgi:iron complex transport system permease protein
VRALVAVFICAFIGALVFGALNISAPDVLAWMVGQTHDNTSTAMILSLRVPRVICAALAGATLSVAGCALQGLFRNPLADPGLVGISSGASVGAALAILLGNTFLALWAFGGAFVAVVLVSFAASRNGRMSVPVLILSGVAINAIAGAVLGLFAFLSNEQQLRDFTFWTLGSLAAANWHQSALLAGGATLLLGATFCCAPCLNALGLGEDEAHNAGYRVELVKWSLIGVISLGVGASVSLAGAIGFVGLAGPHITRMFLGLDHRWNVPGSAFVGATLLVLADLLARALAAPAEIPVGVICAAIGGPFFLGLILRNHRSLS